MEAAHPWAVLMHKVNFDAQMLQDVFTKLKIHPGALGSLLAPHG
jgi:hypothetical protein